MGVLKNVRRSLKEIKYRGQIYKVSYSDFFTTDEELNKDLYTEVQFTYMDEMEGESSATKVTKDREIFSAEMARKDTLLRYLGDGIFEDLTTKEKLPILVPKYIPSMEDDIRYSANVYSSYVYSLSCDLPADELSKYPIGVKVDLDDYSKKVENLNYGEETKQQIIDEYRKVKEEIRTGAFSRKRKEQEQAKIKEETEAREAQRRKIRDVVDKVVEKQVDRTYDINRLVYGTYSDRMVITDTSDREGVESINEYDDIPVYVSYHTESSYPKEFSCSGIFYRTDNDIYIDLMRNNKIIGSVDRHKDFIPLANDEYEHTMLTKEQVIELYRKIEAQMRNDEQEAETSFKNSHHHR